MLWNIISPLLCAIGIIIVTAVAEVAINTDYIFFSPVTRTVTTGPHWLRGWRGRHEFTFWRTLKTSNPKDLRRILIPGTIIGVDMYLVLWLACGIWSGAFLEILWYILSVVMIVAVLSVIAYFVFRWHQNTQPRVRELLWFLVLAAFVAFPVTFLFFASPVLSVCKLLSAGMLNILSPSVGEVMRPFFGTTIPVTIFIVYVGLLFFFYFYNNWKNGGKKYLIVIGVIVLIVALLASTMTVARGADWNALPKSSGNGGGTAQNIAGTPGPTAADLDAAIADLTIPEVTPEELEMMESTERFQDISWKLLDSSLASKDKSRTESTGFSDALTFGFKAKDDDGRHRELYEETLRNPVYAITILRAVVGKEIAKGQTFGDLNPWMAKAIQRDDTYGVVGWCQYRDSDRSVLYVTTEFRCIAATLCNLYDRLIPQGIQTRQTIENWCLSANLASNDRKGVLASYQYKKEAWVLMWIGKDEAESDNPKGLFVIGFNIHDKRPEFFGEEDPPEVVKIPTNNGDTPKTTPTSPSNPKGDDPTEEPTQPSRSKDPKDDPVNNNNANKGGGNNRASDGSGDYQPEDPRNEDSGTSSKPQTPTVAPEHRSDDIVDHEDAMDYTPDPVTDRGPIGQNPQTSPDGDGEFVPDD